MSSINTPAGVDVRGPRFAGVPLLGIVATAAFLNAAFGICPGCQLYPPVTHVRKQPKGSTPWHAPTS